MNTDKIVEEKIARNYAPKGGNKLTALKKLDRLARSGAEIFALAFGFASALVFGTGLCFAMGVLGNGKFIFIAIGVVIGLLGILGASINYFIYKKLLEKGKMKYGSDIIRLAQEIAEE